MLAPGLTWEDTDVIRGGSMRAVGVSYYTLAGGRYDHVWTSFLLVSFLDKHYLMMSLRRLRNTLMAVAVTTGLD